MTSGFITVMSFLFSFDALARARLRTGYSRCEGGKRTRSGRSVVASRYVIVARNEVS